jgi:hypothetical protein
MSCGKTGASRRCQRAISVLHERCAAQAGREKSSRNPHVLVRTLRSFKVFFVDVEPFAALRWDSKNTNRFC